MYDNICPEMYGFIVVQRFVLRAV